MEASCAHEKIALVAMNMEVGSHAPGYYRKINSWIGMKSGKTVADVYTSGAISNMSGSDDALLSSATSFSLLTATSIAAAGPVDAQQGCMDFDTETTAPTSNAACSGLDYLTEVPTPVIDSSGKFSAKWILNTAKSKLVEIPSM